MSESDKRLKEKTPKTECGLSLNRKGYWQIKIPARGLWPAGRSLMKAASLVRKLRGSNKPNIRTVPNEEGYLDLQVCWNRHKLSEPCEYETVIKNANKPSRSLLEVEDGNRVLVVTCNKDPILVTNSREEAEKVISVLEGKGIVNLKAVECKFIGSKKF